jgi:hypothetical protein
MPAVASWCSKAKKRGEVWSELTTNHVLDLPDEAGLQTMVLGEINLQWSQSLQSFISKGQKTALVSMDGDLINKYIEATIEYHNPSNKDDRIYLILKSPNGNSYYFNYKKGILHTYSDNAVFNETIAAMKEKDRIIEAKQGTTYELQLTTPELVEAYRSRIRE